MLTWQYSITFPVITYPCFQQRTDWSTRLSVLLNHNFQCKERGHVEVKSSNISQGWTQNPKLKLEVHAWVGNPTHDKPHLYLHNGSPKGKGSTSFDTTVHYIWVCSEALTKWNMMHPKIPSWGRKEVQHQEKYCASTYCTCSTPKTSLSRELYLRTCLLSLGGT